MRKNLFNLCNPSYLQVSHKELKYKKIGLIGTLKIVSCLGDASNVTRTSQFGVRSNIIAISNFTTYLAVKPLL